MRCDDVRALAPELAVGAAGGGERAAAQAHLDACVGCRAEVAHLTETAEALLLATPSRPPPAGFERRVLARVRPLRRRRRYTAAAAAVAVLAAFSLGRAVRTGPPPRQAVMVADGRPVGRVVVSGGRPALLAIDVHGLGRDEEYRVELALSSGRAAPAGELRTRDGRGTAGLTADVPASDVRSVRLVDLSGRWECEARF